MTIILVRHGETLLNVARTLQPADTPLGPHGHAQAALVAQRLAALQPAAILSSDLPRALQTAQAIAAATGLPIKTTPLLHERNFGDLRGQPYDTLGYDPLTMGGAPPGGESAAVFHARAARAFAAAVAMRAALAGPLVVVTHGLVIRSLLARVLGVADPDGGPHRLGNTSVTVVSAAAPHAVELLDCTRHLDEADDDGRGYSGRVTHLGGGTADGRSRPPHQRVGAKAGGTLACLALEADHAAENEGGGDADERVRQGSQVEVVNRFHLIFLL